MTAERHGLPRASDPVEWWSGGTPPRVLVLGANGFIGRTVCGVISEHPGLGSLIRHVRTPAAIAAGRNPGYDLTVALDLLAASSGEIAVFLDYVRPQIIVNCTGATVGSRAQLDLANVGVVDRLLTALKDRPDTCFVQIGSAAEYGQTAAGEPVREDVQSRPTGAYGQSKLASSQAVLEAVRLYGLRGTVLRVFNPIGPGASDQTLPGHAERVLRAALDEGSHEVHLGSLSHWRDYVDVRDVAWAALAAAATPGAAGRVLNVARGEAVQSRAFVNCLAEAAGFRGQIVENEAGSGRSSGLAWQQADITEATRLLPWRPRHSVAEAAHALWAAGQAVCAA